LYQSFFYCLAESVCLPKGGGGVVGGLWDLGGLGVAPLEVCRFGGSTARTSLFVFFGFSASLISRHYMSDIFALEAWVDSPFPSVSPLFFAFFVCPIVALINRAKK